MSDSEKIKDYQNKFAQKISNRIQKNIKTHQEAPNCEDSNKLICDIQGKTPYELGLGCQLHTYASGLMKILFILINLCFEMNIYLCLRVILCYRK